MEKALRGEANTARWL